MTTARDIMSGSAECAQTTDTLADAARKIATSTSVRCPSAARTTA